MRLFKGEKCARRYTVLRRFCLKNQRSTDTLDHSVGRRRGKSLTIIAGEDAIYLFPTPWQRGRLTCPGRCIWTLFEGFGGSNLGHFS
ncbi:hypothetical protein E2C01_017057 [Portunus trituberculatus]|uniref:Uncharacterized protein n=1 Tax=Portunus trituberculatus TaxID=210409 RepID=A0A5B7DS55_PORTR|nr:hypothetical protein [Portunus trituberculatus]